MHLFVILHDVTYGACLISKGAEPLISHDLLMMSCATWYKGSVYGAFRREFLHEAVMGTAVGPIRDFMLKLRNIMHPDDFYFPILAYNSKLRLPGACVISASPHSEVGYNYMARFVIWGGYNVTCTTKYVRGVCILGTDHVALLQSVPHISANKFHAEYQPEAYDEMEQWCSTHGYPSSDIYDKQNNGPLATVFNQQGVLQTSTWNLDSELQ
ncbi:unnamed protein product [Mesocestoides corti]|uniref:Uncharacterized protein n=1 Tax=Mesocestoides corti TaxID=53468 RepID=A0A0R3UQ97_MESCO|nr:unnamed protein product [Mesocestoides corti]